MSCNRIFSASYNDMISYIALDRIMVCVPHNRILYRSDVNGSQKRKCEQGKQETRGLSSDKEANGGEAKWNSGFRDQWTIVSYLSLSRRSCSTGCTARRWTRHAFLLRVRVLFLVDSNRKCFVRREPARFVFFPPLFPLPMISYNTLSRLTSLTQRMND